MYSLDGLMGQEAGWVGGRRRERVYDNRSGKFTGGGGWKMSRLCRAGMDEATPDGEDKIR